MNRHLFILILFCVTVFVASFFVATSKESTAAYSLSIVSFACVVALYSAGVLGYKVGGNYLSLESKVSTLEKENTELKKSVTALLKSIYAMADGASRWDGPPEQHYKLIDEYLGPINHLVAPGAKDEVKADIAKLFPHENP